MSLLLCTCRSLAAEEGWEPSTSSGDSPRLPLQRDRDGAGAHGRPPCT